jgi:hypothetical protein
MDRTILRNAEPEDSGLLTALTQRSKAHWGYPQAMLDQWKDILVVSDATIRDGNVVVAERDGVPAGYYNLTGDRRTANSRISSSNRPRSAPALAGSSGTTP